MSVWRASVKCEDDAGSFVIGNRFLRQTLCKIRFFQRSQICRRLFRKKIKAGLKLKIKVRCECNATISPVLRSNDSSVRKFQKYETIDFCDIDFINILWLGCANRKPIGF